MAWYWFAFGFCQRLPRSLVEANRFSESMVGMVSPALSSLSKPQAAPALVTVLSVPRCVVSYQ